MNKPSIKDIIFGLVMVASAGLSTWAVCKADVIQGEKGEKGDPGTNGYNGYKGDKGDTGKDGKDGNTPYIYEGYWWIGNTNTNVKATGDTGATGDKGDDGLTPYIGADGYWYIGDESTGVKATGENGKDGTNGTDGITQVIVTTQEKADQLDWTGIPANGTFENVPVCINNNAVGWYQRNGELTSKVKISDGTYMMTYSNNSATYRFRGIGTKGYNSTLVYLVASGTATTETTATGDFPTSGDFSTTITITSSESLWDYLVN